jgi:ubiquinone biosynthesis protein UbiJ
VDILKTALQPIASVLNRNISETTPARKLCAELSGAVFAVRVRDTALATYFIVHDDVLELVTDTDREPDVVVTGSLITLARMAGPAGESLIRDGSVDLTGDAETAQQFQQLLKLARPDVEEELSGLVGDVAAHQLGEFARGVARWSKGARATMGANIREYLQEESRDAPSRYEVDRFSARVGGLRDDVDRLVARVARLRGDR